MRGQVDMASLLLDDFNAVKTTDHRLCRRMCRDYLFRGNNASKVAPPAPARASIPACLLAPACSFSLCVNVCECVRAFVRAWASSAACSVPVRQHACRLRACLAVASIQPFASHGAPMPISLGGR